MQPPSLLRRPPAEVSVALTVDRADLFLEGAKKLLGALPWVVQGAAQAALSALLLHAGLKDLDLLDPWYWQQRGFDPAGGAGLWIADDNLSAVLVAVQRRSDVEHFLRDLLRDGGRARPNDDDDQVTVGVQADGSVQGAFGFVDRFAWLSMPVASREQAQATRRLVLAARDGEGGEAAHMLNATPGPPHALRGGGRRDDNGNAIGMSAAPGDRELRLGLVMQAGILGGDASILTAAGTAPDAAAPPKPLAVLTGLDLGRFVREVLDGDKEPSEDPPQGVAALVLSELDEALIPQLLNDAEFDDVVRSGALHGALCLRPPSEEPWRRWLDAQIERGEIHARGKGSTRVYCLPFDPNSSEQAMVCGFERGMLFCSLAEADLQAARKATYDLGSNLARSLDDPEARRLLERGEPFLYARVAELAERLKGLVLALVKEGSWGKGLGAHELLQVLARIKDATGQLQPNVDGLAQAWLKLRLR